MVWWGSAGLVALATMVVARVAILDFARWRRAPACILSACGRWLPRSQLFLRMVGSAGAFVDPERATCGWFDSACAGAAVGPGSIRLRAWVGGERFRLGAVAERNALGDMGASAAAVISLSLCR